MTKDIGIICSNCGEQIDGPSYANPSEPSENLCEHCHRTIKMGNK